MQIRSLPQDWLQKYLNQNHEELKLDCEITEDNVKNLVVFKEDGKLTTEENALKTNKDYFVSYDLRKALEAYFNDALNTESDGIYCPISFEILNKKNPPVILCPEKGQIAGTILSAANESLLQNKTDPKTRGKYQSVIPSPIISFLVKYLENNKQIVLNENEEMKVEAKEENYNKYFPSYFLNPFLNPYNEKYFVQAEYPDIDAIKNKTIQLLSNYISGNSYLNTNPFSLFRNPANENRQAWASQLLKKAHDLNAGNLDDFIQYAKRISDSIRNEYSYSSPRNSCLYQCVEEIMCLHNHDEDAGFRNRLSI